MCRWGGTGCRPAVADGTKEKVGTERGRINSGIRGKSLINDWRGQVSFLTCVHRGRWNIFRRPFMLVWCLCSCLAGSLQLWWWRCRYVVTLFTWPGASFVLSADAH